MSVYKFFSNVTAVQTIGSVQKSDGSQSGNQAVQPIAGNPYLPPQSQAYQVNITGTGAVSASVQPVASEDGINWATYGSAISVSGSYSAAAVASSSNAPHAWYSAYVSAISGTNAAVSCSMSC